MVNILGISGSPRKAATYHCVELALEAATGENSVIELIALHGKVIKPCVHCDRCLRERILCHKKDFMVELYPKLMWADAIIVGSPVYAMNMTPQLSAFFSRWRPLHHVKRGVMRNKLFAGIAVGGKRNGGQEMTVSAMAHAAFARGLIVIGNEPGFYSGGMVWSRDNGYQGVEEDEIGKDSVIQLGKRVAEIARIMELGRNSFVDRNTS